MAEYNFSQMRVGYEYVDVSVAANTLMASQVYGPPGCKVTGGGFTCWDQSNQFSEFKLAASAPASNYGWSVAGWPVSSGKVRIIVCYILADNNDDAL